MGSLEKEVKIKTRKANIQKIVLQTIAVAGLLSVAVLAPNALTVLKQFEVGKLRKKNPKYVINQSVERLLEAGLISFKQTDRGKFIRLTREGEAKLRVFEVNEFKFKRPKRWDGKWRVIIFDVKEERRSTRNKIRRTLSAIGFIQLQRSVWVFPYDCEDLITLIKADFKIGKDVLYMIVDTIENDKSLRNFFGLKQRR